MREVCAEILLGDIIAYGTCKFGCAEFDECDSKRLPRASMCLKRISPALRNEGKVVTVRFEPPIGVKAPGIRMAPRIMVRTVEVEENLISLLELSPSPLEGPVHAAANSRKERVKPPHLLHESV